MYSSETISLSIDAFSSDLQRDVFVEAWEHDDIVQFSFMEHYNNMTIKSIMMLQWAGQWQPTFLVRSSSWVENSVDGSDL